MSAPLVRAAAVSEGDELDFHGWKSSVTRSNVTPKGKITLRFSSRDSPGEARITTRPDELLVRWVDRPCGHTRGCTQSDCMESVPTTLGASK